MSIEEGLVERLAQVTRERDEARASSAWLRAEIERLRGALRYICGKGQNAADWPQGVSRLNMIEVAREALRGEGEE